MTDCAAVYDASDSSSGQGGGIYCKAKEFYIGYEKVSGTETYRESGKETRVTGCRAGQEGGGVFYYSESGDNSAANAAGVYLKNGKTLTIGSAERAKQALTDASTINNNFTAEGKASDLRLRVKDNKNAVNSVLVQCGLSGEILVVNAAIRMWSERVLPSVC